MASLFEPNYSPKAPKGQFRVTYFFFKKIISICFINGKYLFRLVSGPPQAEETLVRKNPSHTPPL